MDHLVVLVGRELMSIWIGQGGAIEDLPLPDPPLLPLDEKPVKPVRSSSGKQGIFTHRKMGVGQGTIVIRAGHCSRFDRINRDPAAVRMVAPPVHAG